MLQKKSTGDTLILKVCSDSGPLFTEAVRRDTTKSREVSKPRDGML